MGEQNGTHIRLADADSAEDVGQIVEIARQWPAQFVPDAMDAIEGDLHRFPCFVLVRENIIHAFLIVIPTSLELELLWAAARKSAYRRSHYMRLLFLAAEKEYFHGNPRCLLAYAKMAAPDASIPDAPEFQGNASAPMRKLLTQLGYKPEYRLESYWKTRDHCILIIKRKTET